MNAFALLILIVVLLLILIPLAIHIYLRRCESRPDEDRYPHTSQFKHK